MVPDLPAWLRHIKSVSAGTQVAKDLASPPQDVERIISMQIVEIRWCMFSLYLSPSSADRGTTEPCRDA